ncbi:MAG TPA: proline--tRNA ligase [Phycisphaerae bacterium]|nr:proline--tRNA ligase [Phycisphaerae bacterium]
MRWTEFFIPTTKEVPKDAVVASHQLMLRAGLVRQAAAGVYSYLPLGYRTLRKVEAIVREEMDRAGGIELHLPVLLPLETWEQTGRTIAMGDTLLRLGGPKGDWRTQTVLGPTHEEPITEIARAYLKSYKQLPINLYQIQVKFRGEARPKSGVLRTREFLMKDAYSFHDRKASLDETYKKMYEAYCRIFARCGLPYTAVEAESGPIGGDASHEFMVQTDAGEDLLVRCFRCGYAANVERAEFADIPQDDAAMEPMREVHTPNQRTIDEVTEFLGTVPSKMIKTLVYNEVVPADQPGPAKPVVPVVALVRGDHEVNENKLNRLAGTTLELADPDTIRKLTSAEVGFAGPQGLNKSGMPYRLVIDQAVTAMRNGASGACRTDYHVTGVNPGRDFPLEGPNVIVGDIRSVVQGDRCRRCGHDFDFQKCIETGHVFKLGTKYSDALGATFLDKDGKSNSLIMGCYGIGLNRIVAAAIEASHDEDGIIWPMSIAPFQVIVLALDPRMEDVMKTAGELHDQLAAAGIEVLFDDRDERAGFKFKDADLIGIPLRITVGRKSLNEGVVELKRRDAKDVERLAPAAAIERAKQLVAKAMKALQP